MKPYRYKLPASLVASICLLATLTLIASERSAASQCQVVNLMPLFWGFWENAKDQPRPEQVRLFKEMVAKEHPEVYTEGVLAVGSDTANLDAQIGDFLRHAANDAAAMREMSNALDHDLPGYLVKFEKEFPDFRCESPLYFLVSLGAFDGAERFVNGTPALLFGVDVIAAIHPHGALGVLFDHELFHLYHRQITGIVAGIGVPLYLALWEEGLATYVSQLLNPAVSESEVLGRPKDLAQRVRPLLPQIARELLQNMDRTSTDEYKRFFFLGGSAKKDIPPRCGYYVGLLVARELGGTRSLQELARIDGEPLPVRLRRVLEEIANQRTQLWNKSLPVFDAKTRSTRSRCSRAVLYMSIRLTTPPILRGYLTCGYRNSSSRRTTA